MSLKRNLEDLASLIPLLEPYPLWVKGLVGGWILLSAILIIALLFFKGPGVKNATPESVVNLVKNGGFEEGISGWGSGYVEDLVRNGNFPPQPKFPYITSGEAKSTGELDTTEHHDGVAAYKVHHVSAQFSHRWGSISQRIVGLRRHTFYVVSFWVKSRGAESGAVFLTPDLKWEKKLPIDGGEYDWRKYELKFNTGESDYIDLRFVAQAPALVWIDDVGVHELREGK